MDVCRRESGFTLLELVVALALSTLVSLLGAMALGFASDFYARNEARLKHDTTVRTIEKTLRAEWGSRKGIARLSKDAIEFDTSSPIANKSQSGIIRVRYTCVDDRDKSGQQVLLHETLQAAKASDRTENLEVETTSQLVGDLRVCEFSALQLSSNKSGDQFTEWVTLWNSEIQLPRLLRLKLNGSYVDVPDFVFVANRPQD